MESPPLPVLKYIISLRLQRQSSIGVNQLISHYRDNVTRYGWRMSTHEWKDTYYILVALKYYLNEAKLNELIGG